MNLFFPQSWTWHWGKLRELPVVKRLVKVKSVLPSYIFFCFSLLFWLNIPVACGHCPASLSPSLGWQSQRFITGDLAHLFDSTLARKSWAFGLGLISVNCDKEMNITSFSRNPFCHFLMYRDELDSLKRVWIFPESKFVSLLLQYVIRNFPKLMLLPGPSTSIMKRLHNSPVLHPYIL